MLSPSTLHKLRKALEPILSKGVLQWLIFQYGNYLPPKRSYSAFGEDLIINQYTKMIGANGFYLDIGCFHPRWGSNTYLLYKRGWRGMAVDLDDHKLAYFRRCRGSRVQTSTMAVLGRASASDEISVYKFRLKSGWSDIDTVDEITAKDYQARGMGDFVVRSIPSTGINELLENLPHVNLLNIDVEGSDLDLIQNLNLRKYLIDMIVFEDNRYHGETVDSFLREHGYRHVFTSGGSVGYALMSFLSRD